MEIHFRDVENDAGRRRGERRDGRVAENERGVEVQNAGVRVILEGLLTLEN